MKLLLTILGIALVSITQANNDSIIVLANMISPGEGSKIYIAEYAIVQTVKGEVSNDTIKVGYYHYKEHEETFDTVLLNLTNYPGETEVKDYYIFPEYDAQKGIEPVEIFTISLAYWRRCEAATIPIPDEPGSSPRKPKHGECTVNLTRPIETDNWFLFLPCHDTLATGVTFTEENGNTDWCPPPVGDECPSVYDLSHTRDGKYFAFMMAGDLYGRMEITLKTKGKKRRGRTSSVK